MNGLNMLRVRVLSCGQRWVLALRVVFLCLAFASAATAASDPLTLHNDKLTVRLDRATGRITAWTNALTGEEQAVVSEEFALETERGRIVASQMQMTGVESANDSARFRFSGDGVDAELIYQLGPGWLEKWVEIHFSKVTDLLRFDLGSRRFEPAFVEASAQSGNRREVRASLHPAELPEYAALRSAQGGWFTGIACPIMEMHVAGDASRLSYPVNVRYQPGTTHVSEHEFLGPFKNAGIVCRKDLRFMGDVRTIIYQSGELTDWGEVWAFQDYVWKQLPPITDNLLGDRMSLNGRWYAESDVPTHQPAGVPIHADAIRRSHDCHLDLFWIYCPWLGMGGYGGYKVNDQMDLSRSFNLALSEPVKQTLRAVAENDLLVDSFCGPDMNSCRGVDEWRVKSEAGEAGQICQGSTECIDWMVANTEKAFTAAKENGATVANWWWDIMGVNCDPVAGLQCHAANHDHLPGDLRYAWWKGTQRLFRQLRQHHPEVALAMCWSVKRCTPWILRDVSTQEHIAENWRFFISNPEARKVLSAADEMRFQEWYCQNYRFMPPWKNQAQLFLDRREDEDWRYSLMSCLASGSRRIFVMDLPVYGQVDARTKDMPDSIGGILSPGDRSIWFSMEDVAPDLARWKDWATKNLDYLMVKRDLFGQPCREQGIDGSAHIIGDRGYLFLFNPWRMPHAGQITLDDRILLTKGAKYRVNELYPTEGSCLGTYARGDKLTVVLQPRAAHLLAIEPYAGPDLPRPTVPSGIDVQSDFETREFAEAHPVPTPPDPIDPQTPEGLSFSMGGTWEPPGWMKVHKTTAYDPKAGQTFGWAAGALPSGDQDWYSAGCVEDHCHWNACIFDSQPRVFSVDLANGDYEVRLYLLSPCDQTVRPTKVTANGQTVYDGTPQPKMIYPGKVRIDNGRLDLKFERAAGPGADHWTVSGVNVRPIGK